MRRPRDLDDYNQCIKVLDNRTLVFCVECDAWRSVKMEATAPRVELLHTGIRKIEIVGGSAKLHCAVCSADINYLLPPGNNRNRVIKQLIRVYAPTVSPLSKI